LTKVTFVRGPFLDTNVDPQRSLNPSTSSGTAAITILSSFAVFTAGHSDSLWIIKDGVVRLTSISSSVLASAIIQAEPDGTPGNLGIDSATNDFAEGALSDDQGWPATVEFHEQRLVYANTSKSPQSFWGSVPNSFDNFDTTSADDDKSYAYKINTRQVNAIRWLASSSRTLEIGTSGGQFSAFSGTEDQPITPSAIVVRSNAIYGSSKLRPSFIGNDIYYIQRDLNKAREISYFVEIDVRRAKNMNLFADHILKDGLGAKDMAQQQSPNDRLWVVRNDGQIAVLTRDAEQEVLGWSRLVAGQTSRGNGVFESVAIIPRDDNDDQVWVITNRNINGVTKRFVEYFSDEDFVDDWEPIRLDSSLTLDDPKTISGATSADPVVITANSHGFSNLDQVKIDGVVGTTELNGNHYLITGAGANTFSLTDLDGNDIDGSAFKNYISGGEVRKMVTSVSGLDHLEGERVSVFVDGGVPAGQQTFIVATGAITLIHKAAVIHVGLPYTGDLQLLKLGDGSATGTGQTKTRRIYTSTIRVYRSLGLKIGLDEDNLDTVFFNEPNLPHGEAPPLVTGDIEKHFGTAWRKDSELLIRQDQPLPLFILAIVLRSDVKER